MKLAKVFKENKQFTLFSILALVVVGVAAVSYTHLRAHET